MIRLSRNCLDRILKKTQLSYKKLARNTLSLQEVFKNYITFARVLQKLYYLCNKKYSSPFFMSLPKDVSKWDNEGFQLLVLLWAMVPKKTFQSLLSCLDLI